jgi:hypothetical protein
VTLSAYLAQTARRLHGAHGYENPRQNAEFMSFREFVDSIAVPAGEEFRFPAFRAWFERRRGGLKGDLRQADAHALLEEFRGVLARAEVESGYRPARKLWKRRSVGYYAPSPDMKLRRKTGDGEAWLPVAEALDPEAVSEGGEGRLFDPYDRPLAGASAASG